MHFCHINNGIDTYITLIISFIFGEDSTGGAVLDYQNQQNVIKEFVKSFKFAFLNVHFKFVF